jgi:hypothetical protein
VHFRLIALSLVAGSIFLPASSALGAPSSPPTAATGMIGVRILDVPASARNDPLARAYIVNRVAPGTTIRRRIQVSNNTASTATIAVYPAAASLRQGQFAFASGHNRNGLSSWTSLSRPVMRLQPAVKAVETVTIHVAKNASSGERYAVIWAEISARGSGGRGVALVNRVGIRMYLSVGAGGAPPSNFAIGPLTARRSAAGQPLVVARIQNNGKRTLDISGNLSLSDGPGGVRGGPFPAKLGAPLSPGDTRQIAVRLDKRLPRGPWRAKLVLRGRSIQRVAISTLKFP